MTDFLHFARRMLHDRWTLIWALVFACLSASAMGAGKSERNSRAASAGSSNADLNNASCGRDVMSASG